MKLYLLEWNNGQSFTDLEVTLLGAYSSQEEREEAKERYLERSHKFPLNDQGRKARFVESEIEVDKDLYQ